MDWDEGWGVTEDDLQRHEQAMAEAEDIGSEDLEAAAEVLDDLLNGSHYAKHEQALRDLREMHQAADTRAYIRQSIEREPWWR